MKLRFGTASLLLATAFIAISLCGSLASWRAMVSVDSGATVLAVVWSTAVSSPYWTPAMFAAYAIGRRRITAGQLVLFGICEAVAFGVLEWLVTFGY